MSGLLTLSNLAAWMAQSACLVAAGLMALRAARLSDPSLRYAFVRGLLAACLLLPVVGPHVETAAPEISVEMGSPLLAGSPPPPTPDHPLRALAAVPPSAVLLLLAAGTLVRLAWMAAGLARLRRLRGAGQSAVDEPAGADLQALLGIRSVEIRYVPELAQTVTFGHRRPVVLLPESLRERPAAIRHAILAHELWHVRRHDWAWTMAEEALRAVFWFHPAIWILLSRIQASREELVDHLTILTTGSRRSYAEALLACAERTPLALTAPFARRRHLVHRLTLIAQDGVMSGTRLVAACAILVGVTMPAGWYAAQAFPLVRAQEGSVLSAVAGPLEADAKPLTPENPVPARTRHTAPAYPAAAAAAGASGVLTLRVTVDGTGRVVEARLVAANLDVHGGRVAIDAPARIGEAASASINGQPIRPVLEALASSADRAVRQWQYAAPVEAPVAFDVTVALSSRAPASPAAGATRPSPGPMPAPRATTPERSPDTAPFDAGAVRVGGNILPPATISHVNAEYPAVAKEAGVQGVVVLEVRIEADGSVGRTRVLQSIPLLDAAATDAVRQWRFTPTLMNGAPVPVVTTITVSFTLR